MADPRSKLYDAIGPFTTVPNSIIDMIPKIGHDAYILWSYLRYLTHGESGECFPSYDRIQAACHMRREAIATGLRFLESFDLLERRRHFNAPTHYTLKMPPVALPPAVETEQQSASPPPVLAGQSVSPTGGLTVVGLADTNKTVLNKILPPLSKESASPSARKPTDRSNLTKPSSRGDLARQCWAVFTRLQGFEPATRDERGKRNDAIRQILEAGGLPDEIETIWHEALDRWEDPKMVNPNSIASHWSELRTPLPRVAPKAGRAVDRSVLNNDPARPSAVELNRRMWAERKGDASPERSSVGPEPATAGI